MRIGIIGAGAVAQLHATAASRIPGVELTAVCDLKLEIAQAIAATPNAASFVDYRDLLDSTLVDAVIINTPHGLHKEMVLAAAGRGLDILVEKPMATSVADCDEMEAACAAAGVKLVVGQIQHFLPEKMAVEKALASDVLGSVQTIHDQRSTDYRPGSRSDWFFDRNMAGGGAFMNIGGHCLDRCLWFGGAPVTTVRAMTLDRFGSPVETDGTMVLRLSNGVNAVISITSDSPRKIDEIMLVCERGMITADPRAGTFMRQDGVTTILHEPSEQDIQTGFQNQLEDFVRAVAGGEPKVSNTHARHIVEVVLAAYTSAETGNTVDLANLAELSV